MSTWLRRLPFLFLSCVILSVVGAAPSAGPSPSSVDGSRDPIFVCTERDNCDLCNTDRPPGYVVSFSHYIEQVLRNEWHADSGPEALKAGSVAVRSFADRLRGCGARLLWTYWIQQPQLGYIMRCNRSQVYSRPDPPEFFDITPNHESARFATDGVQMYRADDEIACAKHNTDCGDPTLACDESDCPEVEDRDVLQSVPDPVAKDLDPEIAHGMPQNSTVAWERGSAPAPWSP